ncbi:MAG: hypothetical protein ACM3UR_06995 [Bacteroidota bacterium]|jgi:hypothetical protein|nr:hypothetical protein [Ignavibacteria bacterium]MCU7500736.1 hypothetical protein [Ignavibacteria bacterium]MCU7520877.1 hypothetical protein [Ignavibacteria bacterium]MCU7523554.1 hypothetical protein [Ignavibacteria bacterium]HEX2961886.1 hypothetical protein [Ignavibacteriales bacterium]
MTTLPPPSVKPFPEDSLEKQVYNIVEKYKENIPIMNDRNRLGYNLFKYMSGEGDSPEILVKSTKIKIVGMTKEELAAKLTADLKTVKK